MDLTQLLLDTRELVECESPSTDLAAVARSADVVARVGERRLGVARERIVIDGRTHLRWRLGTGPSRVLLVGHHDTVWPVGSLAAHPWTVEGGVLRGPGLLRHEGRPRDGLPRPGRARRRRRGDVPGHRRRGARVTDVPRPRRAGGAPCRRRPGARGVRRRRGAQDRAQGRVAVRRGGDGSSRARRSRAAQGRQRHGRARAPGAHRERLRPTGDRDDGHPDRGRRRDRHEHRPRGRVVRRRRPGPHRRGAAAGRPRHAFPAPGAPRRAPRDHGRPQPPAPRALDVRRPLRPGERPRRPARSCRRHRPPRWAAPPTATSPRESARRPWTGWAPSGEGRTGRTSTSSSRRSRTARDSSRRWCRTCWRSPQQRASLPRPADHDDAGRHEGRGSDDAAGDRGRGSRRSSPGCRCGSARCRSGGARGDRAGRADRGDSAVRDDLGPHGEPAGVGGAAARVHQGRQLRRRRVRRRPPGRRLRRLLPRTRPGRAAQPHRRGGARPDRTERRLRAEGPPAGVGDAARGERDRLDVRPAGEPQRLLQPGEARARCRPSTCRTSTGRCWTPSTATTTPTGCSCAGRCAIPPWSRPAPAAARRRSPPTSSPAVRSSPWASTRPERPCRVTADGPVALVAVPGTSRRCGSATRRSRSAGGWPSARRSAGLVADGDPGRRASTERLVRR